MEIVADDKPKQKQTLQVAVSPDTVRRIKSAAGARDCKPGEVIDDLAMALPPVPAEGEAV